MLKKQKMDPDFYHLMEEAIKEAEEGFEEGEVPVGAVVADLEGRIISRAHNQPVTCNDPTAHAEILAMRRAASFCGNYRLDQTVLIVTIEPCLMCAGAAINARVRQLVFGAHDPKAGAAGSLYDLMSDQRLNHRMEVVSGVRGKGVPGIDASVFQGSPIEPEKIAELCGEVPKWS